EPAVPPPPPPTLRIALDPDRHQGNGRDLLLQGEEPSVRLSAPYPVGALVRSARLELVYRNGADLLPDASRLSLSGDGVPDSTMTPAAFGTPATWIVP